MAISKEIVEINDNLVCLIHFEDKGKSVEVSITDGGNIESTWLGPQLIQKRHLEGGTTQKRLLDVIFEKSEIEDITNQTAIILSLASVIKTILEEKWFRSDIPELQEVDKQMAIISNLVDKIRITYIDPKLVSNGTDCASFNIKYAWEFVKDKENLKEIGQLDEKHLELFARSLKENFYLFGKIPSQLCDYCKKHGKGNSSKTESEDEDEEISIEDKYPEHILELANMVLEEGTPLELILDIWNSRHVGDRALGYSCACAVSSTYITTTRGLHVKPSGNSGKGKSDGEENYLILLPEDKVINASASAKYLFYEKKLKKGTIIYMDDVQLTQDLITTIKQTTSKYQSKTFHKTVKNQEAAEYEVPERICWMLSSVDGFTNDQMSNRFLGIDVDDTHIQDQSVHSKQKELRKFGVSKETVDDDVLVCRAMYDILGQYEYKIIIPYIDSIKWLDIKNRRNFEMFCDILISVTFYNIMQREKFHDVYLPNIEDFYVAKDIYKELAEFNHTKLTKNELDVMNILTDAQGMELEFKTLQKQSNKPQSTLRKILDGEKGEGGLISKIPGLYKTKVSEKTDDGQQTSKVYYSFEGSLKIKGIESYFDIVGIEEDKIESEIEKWRIEYDAHINNQSISGSTIIPPSYHNHTTIIEDNNIKTSTRDRILNNVSKSSKNDTTTNQNKIMYNSCEDNIIVNISQNEGKNGKVPPASESEVGECYDSGMIGGCFSLQHSDSWISENGPINSSNLEKYVMNAKIDSRKAGLDLSKDEIRDWTIKEHKLTPKMENDIKVINSNSELDDMLNELSRGE
jgi:predicted DNA-binding protein